MQSHWFASFRCRLLLFIVCLFMVWWTIYNWSGLQLRSTPAGVVNEEQHIAGAPLRSHNGQPVVVTVYYEALCPDSKNFVVKQLLPTVQQLPTYVDFALVPYGKATTVVNKDGSLSFSCQHGPTECDANIYHACVIESVDEPQLLLDTVACMIRNNMNPKEAMQRCTREHRIDTEQVQKCFDSPHGAELLRQYGEVTHALQPPVSFIPTVTLDGAQLRQASILKDLLAEVCKILGGRATVPDVC